MSTRLQFAGKLLSASADAGLIQARRDPRPLVLPRVPESALAYLLHLLRSVDFDGTLLDNPYLASVGLVGETLDDRLRTLPGLRFVRQGPLRDLSWEHPSLSAWFDAWRAEHPLERAA